MINLLHKILDNQLSISDEIFISETDLQLNLAKELQNKGCTNVTLEYPIKIDNKNKYIDIKCEYEGISYYIELKYKTKAIKGKKFKRLGLDFCLKNHNAYTDSRYSIYNDIYKLENIPNEPKCIGYILFLTNVDNYEHEHENMPLVNKKQTSKYYNHRGEIFCLKNQYKCEWRDFKNHDGFRYLLIEIK